MEPIRINLATYRYFNRRRINLMVLLAGSVLLLVLVFMTHLGLRNQKEIQQYEKKLSLLETKIAQRLKERISRVDIVTIEPQQLAALQKEAYQMNVLIAKDLFPWCQILDTIENAMPEKMVLDHLSHSQFYDKILLSGHSTSMEEITGFLKHLDDSDIFDKSMLVKVNMEQQSTGQSAPMATFEIETQLLLKQLYAQVASDQLGAFFLQHLRSRQTSEG